MGVICVGETRSSHGKVAQESERESVGSLPYIFTGANLADLYTSCFAFGSLPVAPLCNAGCCYTQQCTMQNMKGSLDLLGQTNGNTRLQKTERMGASISQIVSGVIITSLYISSACC